MRIARAIAGCLLLVLAVGARPAGAGEAPPPLPPSGQQEPAEVPPLPGEEDEETAPPLPGAPAEPPDREEPSFSEQLDRWLAGLPFPLHGFLETRIGPRLVDDDYESSSFTLGEMRLQLDSDPYWRGMEFGLKADFVQDFVLRESLIDVREANVAFRPASWMDVKLGRQVLTWGTGDLLFLNDLFPKDFESFFIGRDVEYLKAPSNSLRLKLFSDLANLDIVYTPRFEPDVFVTGERLSYFNPIAGGLAGEDLPLRTDERSRWFTEDEIHLRLHRVIDSYETALYGYHGFWPGPRGFDPARGQFFHPRLEVWGGSVRGPVADGIGNVEFAWYNSRDDRGGDKPLVPNSQWRLLVGYSQDLPEVATDFTVGVQYYLEHIEEFGALQRNLPAGFPEPEENSHLFTLRLTKLLLQQDLRLDLFTFYGATHDEVYLRPTFSYDITDRWQVDGGMNIFMGDEDSTQFAQFERNSNVYAGLRYSF